MPHLDAAHLGLLFLVATGAAFVDAVAGGGGLITVPALLGLGLPPAVALATNKLQGSCGTAIAAFTFVRLGEIELGRFWPFILCTFAGSVAGTVGVRLVDPSALRAVIPILLIGIAAYVLLSPRASDVEAARRLSDGWFIGLVAPAIGAYDGFFGPGTGSFFAVAFVALLGYSLRRATAHAKVLNFTSNASALAVFMLGGQVLWSAGLVMAAGALIGGQLGAMAVVRAGARLVRPLLVVVSLALTAKLLILG